MKPKKKIQIDIAILQELLELKIVNNYIALIPDMS